MKKLYLLSNLLTTGSNDQLPAKQLPLKKLLTAASSPPSQEGSMTFSAKSFPTGICQPTVRQKPVWHDLLPFKSFADWMAGSSLATRAIPWYLYGSVRIRFISSSKLENYKNSVTFNTRCNNDIILKQTAFSKVSGLAISILWI